MSHAVLYAVAHRFFVTPADLIGPSRQRVDVSPLAIDPMSHRGQIYHHLTAAKERMTGILSINQRQ